jgi:hypothetical protein
VIALVAACGDDPVSFSAPVAINLKAESGAVNGTALANDKGIKEEAGNPYGAFISDARARLGRDPRLVEIDQLTLTLGGQSTGVTQLQEVFQGVVDVLFIVNSSNNTYPVGQIMNPTGTGPTAVDVSFESSAIALQDWSQYLSGEFKVVIRGIAAPQFDQGRQGRSSARVHLRGIRVRYGHANPLHPACALDRAHGLRW